jgi:uncharacterized protein YlxW (UPF0749 family)
MERPLKDRICLLERRIQELNLAVMDNNVTQAERNQLESEIRATQVALADYRTAFELEKQVDTSAHMNSQ